jgi:alkanesulfonate monooxygenase SsuD/methylene tetrahydromethanopterin reductase-like flavin-dependent oxidoreductase (luciferase family)
MAQLRETAHILKRLWTEEQVTWHGQYYTLEAAPGMPQPLQSPLPLWIGGQGENTLLHIVAEAADGWNMVAGKTVAEVQHKREVLWRHCEAVGRDPTTLDTSLFVLTYVYDTAQALAHCRADQERLLGPASLANFDHARVLGLAGSAAQVTETLRHYVALGFDYVIALFPYQRERALLQRYAAEVWPHLG